MFKLKVTSMNRRAFVMSSAAGALSSAALLTFNAGAKEAMIGNKAAAWYRFKLGDFEATVISDGTLNLGPAAALFPKTPKETVEGVIVSQFQSPAALIVQENCLVLNTGDKLVLFDSGMGTYKVFGTAAGRLENTLAASGIKPDDIDAIILTHGHIDHLSGIMSDEGKRLFPNAQIIISKVEHDFWTDEAKTSSTGVMKLLVDSARKNLLPNKDRMVFVEGGKDAIKGVSVDRRPATRRDIRLISCRRRARISSIRGTPSLTPRFPSTIPIGYLALTPIPGWLPRHAGGFSTWRSRISLRLSAITSLSLASGMSPRRATPIASCRPPWIFDGNSTGLRL